MRVLITDKLPAAALTAFEAAGFHCTADPRLEGETLEAAIRQYDPEVLVARSTRINAAHLDAGAHLELVIRAGAGVNTIDVAGAARRGIFVCNCPGMNADAVAELVIGHLIAADRGLISNANALSDGRWVKSAQPKGRGLKGRRLGVLGTGAIGRAVIERALAFRMSVFAWSRSLDEAQAKALGVTRVDSALAVAQQVDCLTVHVAYNSATRHLIGRELLEALPDEAIVINTARGGIVDEAAFAQIAPRKRLRGAFDVFEGEPGADGDWPTPLTDVPHFQGSTHIGASTAQAQMAVAQAALNIALAYRETGLPPNCVNLAAKTPATQQLIVRHLDQVGVLAGVLERLRVAEINIQTMRNVIFDGAEAACAQLQIEGTMSDAVIADLQAVPAVLAVKVVPI